MAERASQFQTGELVPGTSYRVEELIGSGGMGSVYRVEHAELGRRFVLKALHGHLASRPDLVARLKNEWRALGKLEHPNIVQVTDAGQTSRGLPFYVMEHLRGTTLAQLLTARKRLNSREACLLVIDILAGLHAAHQTGAVHRDIKPPNIFIVEGGRAKLLDFGIAKLRDQSAKVVTAGGISIGTPRYMAPEQASGTVVDGRADIYATALVLYEMVVGRGPFSHIRDPNDLVMAHIGQEPERADFLEPQVPPELADLLQRWLSKSPDNRPASAEFARRELSALCESLPPELCTVNEEVTIGGTYDAATLGAGGSVADEVDILAESEAVPLVVSSPDIETGDERLDATISMSTTKKPPAASRPSAMMRAETLGWGTAAFGGVEDTSLGQVETGQGTGASPRQAFPGRRASVTPPPVSSHRPGPLRSSRTTLMWIAGTAAVSFLLAWGISRFVQERGVDEAVGQEARSVLSEGATLERTASGPRDTEAGSPPPPRVELPPVVPASEPAAAPSAEETDNGHSTATDHTGAAPAPARAQQGKPAHNSRGSAESVASAPAPAKQPAPRPVKKRPAERQSSPPVEIDDQLPESGLW